MSTFQALIFDVDGTMADTERDGHRVAFNLAFAEKGLDWDWTEEIYGDLLSVTGGKERIAFFLSKYQPKQGLDADSDEQRASIIADLHAAKTRHYTDLLQKGDIPLRPGILRIITEARELGLRIAIATTTTPVNVTALLTATLGKESIDWFEVIAAGDIVPAKKPAGDIYEYALKEMNLSADNCIALEDSLNGVRSSLAANIKTVITVNGYTQDDDFSGAALVLDQLGEVDSPCKTLSSVDQLVADKVATTGYVDVAVLKSMFAA